MIDKKLDNVLVKFPAFRGRIIELFSTNEEFKSLCEDYWQCRDSIASFEFESRRIHSTQRQFTNLAVNLEQEMMKYLQIPNDQLGLE